MGVQFKHEEGFLARLGPMIISYLKKGHPP
jgi:hypothetical protein